jgi:Mn-dependent DtxR family transcriptional regulator
MEKLSFAMENYLETVYELSEGGDGARITDIAAKMSVTKSTASLAMASLTGKGLTEGGRYSRIALTEKGKEIAAKVAGKHETIQLFFAETLCLDEETASEDACAIEHVISDKAVSAMGEYLARVARDRYEKI